MDVSQVHPKFYTAALIHIKARLSKHLANVPDPCLGRGRDRVQLRRLELRERRRDDALPARGLPNRTPVDLVGATTLTRFGNDENGFVRHVPPQTK